MVRLDLQRLKAYVHELADRLAEAASRRRVPGCVAFSGSAGDADRPADHNYSACHVAWLGLRTPRQSVLPAVAEAAYGHSDCSSVAATSPCCAQTSSVGTLPVTRDREAAVGRLRKAVEMFDVCGCSWLVTKCSTRSVTSANRARGLSRRRPGQGR